VSFLTLAPQPWLIFLDDAGIYIPNGQLAIYQAGTSTPVTTYADTTGVAHPFPITLDCAGRVPGGLYLDSLLQYKFVLHRPQIEAPLDGAIIKSQDNITPYATEGGRTLTLPFPGEHVALDVTGVNLILYSGAGDLIIRGMAGGIHGQTILIRNVTPTSVVWLYNDDPAAPVGSKFANLIANGPMPLVGYRSSTSYTYINGSGWWMNTYEMGAALTPPFDGANYRSRPDPALNWIVQPGNVSQETFFLSGRELTYTFGISGTAVNNTPANLTRELPYGWRAFPQNYSSNILVSTDGVTSVVGNARLFSASDFAFKRVPVQTNWPTSANGIGLFGQITIALA
jgi:hypothetical protein